jgi:hypothetical protein
VTNNLTTIAALPSGSGCKSSLPSEVGEVRKFGWPFLVQIDTGPQGEQINGTYRVIGSTVGGVATAELVERQWRYRMWDFISGPLDKSEDA